MAKRKIRRKNSLTKAWRRVYAYGGLAIASCALLVCGYYLANFQGRHTLGASTSTNIDTTITVEASKVVASVPARYQGLSFETSNTCKMVGIWDQDIVTESNGTKVNVFEQLLKNLGAQTIRIGGVSADKNALWGTSGSYECVSGKTVITPQLIDQLYDLSHRVGAKVIWTLNLGNYAPSTSSQEANYLITKGAQVGGSSGTYLWGLAIGNEPDLFVYTGVKSSYDVTHFISDWSIYKNTIRKTTGHPAFKFVGDDNASNATWFSTFLSNESGNLSRVTKHFYPTQAGSTDPAKSPTISNLLSPSLMQRTTSNFDTWKKQSGNIPLAIDETNSTAGGQRGVSDTFAAALWALDYNFSALEHGVSEVNYHTGGSPTIYSPITNYNHNQWIARPLYYGMLAFHQAAPDGTIAQTSTKSPYNVVAHSDIDSRGALHVVVINKDLSHQASARISAGKQYLSASFMRLEAPSVTATSGVTLGARNVKADGTWRGASTQIQVVNGDVQLAIPQASAVVITFQRSAPATQPPDPSPAPGTAPGDPAGTNTQGNVTGTTPSGGNQTPTEAAGASSNPLVNIANVIKRGIAAAPHLIHIENTSKAVTSTQKVPWSVVALLLISVGAAITPILSHFRLAKARRATVQVLSTNKVVVASFEKKYSLRDNIAQLIHRR